MSQKATPPQFGANMWLIFAQIFADSMEAHGITDQDAKTLAWTGLISAASGHMLHQIGPEATQMVLDAAKNGSSQCMRDRIRLVPK